MGYEYAGTDEGQHPCEAHVRATRDHRQLSLDPTMKTMLTVEARSRLAVVLVGARNPQNIGAAARAMQDFGFGDLRVVNEFGAPFEAAQLTAKSAVGAGDIMQSARLFASLPEAIADCTLIAATTAIGGRELRQPVVPLADAAGPLRDALRAQLSEDASEKLQGELKQLSVSASYAPALVKGTQISAGDRPALAADSASTVALLFGSEKTGLTNEQLSHCSLLLTIPMFAPLGRHLSMNLGQAVAVCLYELTREGFEGARDLPVLHSAPATGGDRERLTGLLLEAMHATDYARRFPANARVEVVRQLVGKLGGSRDEAATWMGLLKSIVRSLSRQRDAPEDHT